MLARRALSWVVELVAHMWMEGLVLEATEAGVHTPTLASELVSGKVYDTAYWVDCGRHSHAR